MVVATMVTVVAFAAALAFFLIIPSSQIRTIRQIPGRFGRIILATFNNLLGGVFMALMDPYGLALVSVEVRGLLWVASR